MPCNNGHTPISETRTNSWNLFFQKKLYGGGCTVSYSSLSLHFGILIRAKLLPVLYKKECCQRSTPFSQICTLPLRKRFKAQGCDSSDMTACTYFNKRVSPKIYSCMRILMCAFPTIKKKKEENRTLGAVRECTSLSLVILPLPE